MSNQSPEAMQPTSSASSTAPKEFNGWYCAHCERGVDGSEVTYREHHTVCGRVITDDVPPTIVPQVVQAPCDVLSADDYKLWAAFLTLREMEIDDVPLPNLVESIRQAISTIAAPIVATGDLSTTVQSDTEYGWLVENGRSGSDLRYRTIDCSGITWTDDHNKALRFARRADAEMFAAEDEDAWCIVQHGWHNAAPISTATEQASDDVTCEMMNRGADAMREGMIQLKEGRSYQYVCTKIFEAMIDAARPMPTNLKQARNLRNTALDEAVCALQKLRRPDEHAEDHDWVSAVYDCEDAIRALKSAPAAKGNAPDEVKS